MRFVFHVYLEGDNSLAYCYVYDCYYDMLFRQANVLASNGDPTLAEARNVTLNAVYFEDLLTGSMTEITSDWNTKSCRTRVYTGSPSLDAAGVSVNSDCSFSDADTLTTLENSAALCQGIVKAVYYTVTHSTSTAAPITTVTATVTLTDAPMTLTTGAAVTITQTFAIDFTSADTTEVNSDNGNQVKRYVIVIYKHIFSKEYFTLIFEVIYILTSILALFGSKQTAIRQSRLSARHAGAVRRPQQRRDHGAGGWVHSTQCTRAF